jgi:hypothetical protein
VDATRLVGTVETYALEYGRQLASLFRRPASGDADCYLNLGDGRLFRFALVNAIIGYTYYFLMFRGGADGLPAVAAIESAGKPSGDIDYLGGLIPRISYWILLTVVVGVATNLFNRPVKVMEALQAVFRVLPAAYLVSAFTAFVAFGAAQYFYTSKAWPLLWGAGVFAGAQVVMTLIYFPRSLALLEGVSVRRRWTVGVLAVLLAVVVDGAPFVIRAEEAITAAEQKEAAAEKAEKERLAQEAKAAAAPGPQTKQEATP